MKKKIRSRLSSSFSLAFIIAILICIAGSSGNFFGFYRNFTSTLFKINENPVAIITFKYKTAQRKFLERLVWDRLKQESPLYDGDTVHTADMAEATITFTDGNRIVLYESTMVQIWASENGSGAKKAKVLSGSLSADFENETGDGITIEAPSVSDIGIKVGAGSNVNVGVDKGGYVQVVTGSASVSLSDGTEKTVNAGEAVEIAGKEVKIPELTVSSPSPDQKILYHTEGNCKVNFAWKGQNLENGKNLLLEIAADKKFESVSQSIVLDPSSEKMAVYFEPGKYYWRIRTENQSEKNEDDTQIAVGSRIQIIQSLPPVLISPVTDYEFSYRTKNPAVRFIWSESNQAASYRLVIADNRHLDNPVVTQRLSSASSIISTLGEGTYWWQITPYFTVNREGFAAHSEIHSFKINKNGLLEKPLIFAPADKSVVNIETDAKNTFFSWKQEDEAVRYNVEFSKNQDFTGNVKKSETQENFISLNGKENFSEGQWFWRVTQTDIEGNISAPSETKTFYALNGKPEQHLIEPVDGYRVAHTLIPDQSFTWKKNLPDCYESRMEISDSESFANIVYSSPADGFSVSGVNIPVGKYWWRLVSEAKNNEGPDFVTDAKCLEVLPNLPKPEMIAPTAKAVSRELMPFEYSWKPVEEADFYKVYVYREETNELIYEDVIYGESFELDMYNRPEFVDKAFYRCEVQGKSNAITGVQSRRSGDLAETKFQLLKLKPVEVTVPEKGAVLDGIQTAINKIQITWNAVDDVSEAQVIVSRKPYKKRSGKKEEILRIPSDKEFKKGNKVAPETLKIENTHLREGGEYEVLVLAKTLDGIDISNKGSKYLGTFTVTPVKPLPASEKLTAEPAVFDSKYLSNLKNPRSITLNWAAVKDATDYIVEIKNSKNKVFFHKEISGKTTAAVNWADLIKNARSESDRKNLYSGEFTCTVEAVRKIDADNDGKKETEIQPGILKNSTFKTDVQMPKSATGKGAKNPYGL